MPTVVSSQIKVPAHLKAAAKDALQVIIERQKTLKHDATVATKKLSAIIRKLKKTGVSSSKVKAEIKKLESYQKKFDIEVNEVLKKSKGYVAKYRSMIN